MSNEPLNPVDLEQKILEVKNRVHAGIKVFSQKLDAYLDAQTECEHAESVAFLDHDGPQTEKRHAARVAIYDLRKAMNQAKVEFQYTEKKLDALVSELFALLNLNKGVRAAYNAERGFGG